MADKGFPERPNRVLVGILLLAIILGGHLAAPTIADLASVPRPWSYVTAGLGFVIVLGATATLTTLAYCLTFFRDVEAARSFLKWVANYAGIGAVLGTLLGCRMAGHLVTTLPDARRLTFNGFLGVVSNTATLLTLFMIATCWWRLWGLLKAVVHESAETATAVRWRFPAWAQIWPFLFVGNYAGFVAGQAVWTLLT